jgi:hypothetical protein
VASGAPRPSRPAPRAPPASRSPAAACGRRAGGRAVLLLACGPGGKGSCAGAAALAASGHHLAPRARSSRCCLMPPTSSVTLAGICGTGCCACSGAGAASVAGGLMQLDRQSKLLAGPAGTWHDARHAWLAASGWSCCTRRARCTSLHQQGLLAGAGCKYTGCCCGARRAHRRWVRHAHLVAAAGLEARQQVPACQVRAALGRRHAGSALVDRGRRTLTP